MLMAKWNLGLFRERDSSKTPWGLEFRSSDMFIVSTISIAVFTDMFLYSVIVPVMPFALSSRAQIHPNDVQYWVSILVAIYGAALVFFSPFCGWIADRTSSRRLPLLFGLVALGVATAVLNVGTSIGVLILGRVLQGLSAAIVWIVGLALLVDTVGPQRIGQATGWVGIAMSLGILLGPLLGGIVFDKAGYYVVFAMAYVLIGVDIVLRLVLIEKKVALKWLPKEQPSPSTEPPQVDAQGALTGNEDITKDIEMVANTAEDLPISAPSGTGSDFPATDQANPSLAQKGRFNLPPVVTLLASRRLLSALWGIMVQAALLTSFDAVVPLFTHNVFGWDSIGAGLIFLTITIPFVIGPVVGALSDKYGPRWLATAGFIMACPFLVLLRLVHENTVKQKVLLCALLAMIGTALNLTLPPTMAEVSYIVALKEEQSKKLNNGKSVFGDKGAYAQAYALFNMAYAAGCVVGPIWAGMVNQTAGWGTMSWSLGALSAVTAVPTVIWCGGSIFKKMKSRRQEIARSDA
ncbi:MFS general substrate transporter [Aulographum hederae CBS 113979]|uniref:MFS general substrate transporter n=1 Tax=Aulographum hederae CBS 113979 TaxID=1176131 RepID=A0A6G1H6E9_9PEZI|nr:MFS general substrate transporter [Aulographum hederae CBS 113979]